MQNETITVVILEGGKTCREINPLGEEPTPYHPKENPNGYVLTKQYIKWQEAESKLRTWEIENCWVRCKCSLTKEYSCRITGSIHQAQIINGKAVIV